MRLAKKSLLLLLSFFVVISGFAMPVAASTYKDTDGHWAQSDIAKWSEKEIVQGYAGLFRPNDEITRAEFSTILHNIMKYTQSTDNSFTDLSSSDWYYDAMVKLNAAGVLDGNNGQAMPEKLISRQEAAVLVARAFDIAEGTASKTFTDQAEIAEWALDAVHSLVAAGAIQGKPDGSFDPTAPLTRAEAVTIISNLIEELYAKPGEYTGDIDGNVVVNADDVVLNDMEISGDLFVAQGVGEGEVTLNNVVIGGKVIVEGGGANSIIFNNVQVRGALVVNKYNGNVRILATGNTSVSVTTLHNGAMIVTRDLTGGGFETIEIPADIVAGADIVLDGNFKQVVNYSPEVSIKATGSIAELVAEADTNITGDVTVDTVSAKDGISATVNERPANAQPSPDDTSSGGSGSTGGGSRGSDDDDDTSAVAVTGVAIEAGSTKLLEGETLQLTAVVTPANADNKKVIWEVADGEADVASVNADGLVTAIAVGTETIRVTTDDGGYTDEVTVQVVKPALGISVAEYVGAAIAPDTTVDDTVVANSENLSIVSHDVSSLNEYKYETVVTAEAALNATSAEEYLQGKYASFVITVQGYDGKPISDPSKLSVTVTDATYTTVTGVTYDFVPQFGLQLAEEYQEGSFVFLVNAGDPEQIQIYDLIFSHEGYEETYHTILYVPYGTAYVSGIEQIAGQAEVDATLTAGEVLVEGTPANTDFTYIWLRSELAEGPYTSIDGANGATYVLTEADAGKYIRVKVMADQTAVAGWAVSEPVGPVKTLAASEDVFTAIEAAFLGSNSDVNNIVSNLNLMTELDAFPDVSITWTSSDETIVTNTGVVHRSNEADQTVTLTVTLEGVIGDTSKTYALTVKKLESDMELGEFVDPYFAPDYPQAYIKDDTIWVKFKLQQPAEVFMVVNSMNGDWESSVKSVLEGHAGLDDDVIWVDAWPYFHVTDASSEIEFDTGALVDSHTNEARVEFVIRDGDYISEEVTSIVFTQEIVDYVDTIGPELDGAYINRALDAIYLYFDELLDEDGVPSPEDFELSVGQVTDVTLHNYDGKRMIDAYVKLSVTGIDASAKGELTVEYSGTTLRDASLAGNRAEPFTENVEWLDDLQFAAVNLSSDRTIMNIELIPGVNDHEFQPSWSDESRYTVTVNGQEQSFDKLRASHGYDHFDITLKFANPLPNGVIEVSVDASGMVNLAMDAFASPMLSTNEVQELPAPGVPVAEYFALGHLELTFAEEFELGRISYVGGLVIKADDQEYALRGFIASKLDNNKIRIRLNGEYESHIKEALDHASKIYIKYEKVNGDSYHQLEDLAGAVLPDFDYIEVSKAGY